MLRKAIAAALLLAATSAMALPRHSPVPGGVPVVALDERGDSLGGAGASGRVTRPHVHWAVFLDGTAVDPELLLARP